MFARLLCLCLTLIYLPCNLWQVEALFSAIRIKFNVVLSSRWTAWMDGEPMTHSFIFVAHFRKTSWTWQYVFVACLAWRRHSGACLWRRNCLRAIIYTAVHSATGWSLLPRSVSGTDMATHFNDAYTILAIQVFHLPSMLFVFSLPNSGNSLRSWRCRCWDSASTLPNVSATRRPDATPSRSKSTYSHFVNRFITFFPPTIMLFGSVLPAVRHNCDVVVNWSMSSFSFRLMERTVNFHMSCSLLLSIKVAAMVAITMFISGILMSLAIGSRR